MRWTMLGLLLCAAAHAAPPWYDERANLLYYIDDKGDKQPVRSREDWQIRLGHIRASMELVMGELPPKSTEPLAVEIKSETKLPQYSRQHLWFTAEKGDRVPAYLLTPHRREGKLPAMVCLPQTTRVGKDEPAKVAGNASLACAHELAEHGFVCIVVDYPLVHSLEYRTDPYQLGYASATMKGIVNHRRAIDVLESLPNVDREAIGVIGHSLGGHNALFLAVFEPRIKAIVTSCGFNVFARHAKGDVRAWSSRSYMPRIKTVYKDDPKKIPFDFTEVLAALAPRPVFVNAPLHDDPDFEVSGVRDCIVAALPVYRQVYNVADNLVIQYPNAAHSFPDEQRQAAYRFLEESLIKARKQK
jgi:dienelactone hydrolase